MKSSYRYDKIEGRKGFEFMKKNRVSIQIFIVLVLALAVTVGAYMFMKNKTNPKDDHNEETPTKKGEIKFLNSKQDGTVITQKYKAYINDKVLDLEVVYTFKIEDLPESDTSGYKRTEIVEGKLKDITLFSAERKNNSTSQKAELFETARIDKELNSDYFKVIRGTDGKDYIAIATHIYDISNTPVTNYLYILNDNLEVINKTFEDISHCSSTRQVMMIHPGEVGLLSDKNIWYSNQFKYDNIRKNYTSLKIVGDKIYYLYHDIVYDKEGNYGTIEERVYTINNDKLEYTVENSFVAVSKYGEICE